MIIYNENHKVIGVTRQSPCGSLVQLPVGAEPYRTMLLNTCSDYALLVPYEDNVYRMEKDTTRTDDEGERWEVLALSSLEEGLWVPVAEVVENEHGEMIFDLLRIRPNYTNKFSNRRQK